MAEYRINGNTKYTTKEQADIADRYPTWIKSKDCALRTTTVTREEFVQLWFESGKWSFKGKCIGDYTISIKPGDGPITIADCSIVIRTDGMVSRKYHTPEELKAARYERNRKSLEKRCLAKGLPIPDRRVNKEKVVKEPKPRKEKVAPKFYKKSEAQAIKQQMSDLAKQFRGSSTKKENLEEAVQVFYLNSTNPLNARIQELAQVPRTNYRSHNLIAMGVRKVTG